MLGGRARSVGTVTVLYGASGFGKTTLATMASADHRVHRRFGGRVYRVKLDLADGRRRRLPRWSII